MVFAFLLLIAPFEAAPALRSLRAWSDTNGTFDGIAPKPSEQMIKEYGMTHWKARHLQLPDRDCVLGMRDICNPDLHPTGLSCMKCASLNKFALVQPDVGCNQYMARAICQARNYKGCFDFQYHHCHKLKKKKGTKECQKCINYFDVYGLNQQAGCDGKKPFSNSEATLEAAKAEDFCTATCGDMFDRYCKFSARKDEGLAACAECTSTQEEIFGKKWAKLQCTDAEISDRCQRAHKEYLEEKNIPTTAPTFAPTKAEAAPATLPPTQRTPTARPTARLLIGGCSDKIMNGKETDVDCGGDCMPCAGAKKCDSNSDCLSQLCEDVSDRKSCGLACEQSFNRNCGQAIENEGSGSVDACSHCVKQNVALFGAGWFDVGCDAGEVDRFCKISANKFHIAHETKVAQTNIKPTFKPTGAPTTAPTIGVCNNGVQDNFETDVDCGGMDEAKKVGSALVCDPCAFGKYCRVDSDCASGNCPVHQCAKPKPVSKIKISNSKCKAKFKSLCGSADGAACEDCTQKQQVPLTMAGCTAEALQDVCFH